MPTRGNSVEVDSCSGPSGNAIPNVSQQDLNNLSGPGGSSGPSFGDPWSPAGSGQGGSGGTSSGAMPLARQGPPHMTREQVNAVAMAYLQRRGIVANGRQGPVMRESMTGDASMIPASGCTEADSGMPVPETGGHSYSDVAHDVDGTPDQGGMHQMRLLYPEIGELSRKYDALKRGGARGDLGG